MSFAFMHIAEPIHADLAIRILPPLFCFHTHAGGRSGEFDTSAQFPVCPLPATWLARSYSHEASILRGMDKRDLVRWMLPGSGWVSNDILQGRARTDEFLSESILLLLHFPRSGNDRWAADAASHERLSQRGDHRSGNFRLACAWRLRKHGIPVKLLKNHPAWAASSGRSCRTDSCSKRDRRVSWALPRLSWTWFASWASSPNWSPAIPARPATFFAAGDLHRVPLSPQSFFTSSFFSGGTRLRAAAELFRRSRPPQHEESVADFIRRKFGAEILDNLVAPFVSGVYAGDPEQLSVRSAFPTLSRVGIAVRERAARRDEIAPGRAETAVALLVPGRHGNSAGSVCYSTQRCDSNAGWR
jgi:hypothetical protein